jgi:hypothetical protein
VGVKFGMPGFSYMLVGPALTLYWKWVSSRAMRGT